MNKLLKYVMRCFFESGCGKPQKTTLRAWMMRTWFFQEGDTPVHKLSYRGAWTSYTSDPWGRCVTSCNWPSPKRDLALRHLYPTCRVTFQKSQKCRDPVSWTIRLSLTLPLVISQPLSRKLLGYLNGAVVPYKRSQSMIKVRRAHDHGSVQLGKWGDPNSCRVFIVENPTRSEWMMTGGYPYDSSKNLQECQSEIPGQISKEARSFCMSIPMVPLVLNEPTTFIVNWGSIMPLPILEVLNHWILFFP